MRLPMLCWYLLLVAANSLACELRVQVSDFPPYSYQKDGQWIGSRVVLSERLARKLGCEVKYLDIPWARALLLMKSGDLDMMFNMTVTKERSSYIWFTRPHHLERLAFATTLTDPSWQQVDQVARLAQFPGLIALTQGSYLGEAMRTLRQDSRFRHKVVEVAERRAKNELLLRDRTQGLVEDYDYLQYAIANFPEYGQVVLTPLILSTVKVHLGISRASWLMSRQEDIEQALQELDAAQQWFSNGT